MLLPGQIRLSLLSTILLAAPVAAAPTVSTVAPSSGRAAGGTPLTITGGGFRPGATVKVGNVACMRVKVVSAGTIVCVNGARAIGSASVTVFNTAIDSSATNMLFTYDSSTDLTKTTKADFETAGSSRTNLVTTGLDSTLRWLDWTPTTGGSMTLGTYYYVIAATNAAGESKRSVQSQGVALAPGQSAVRLDWTAISGAL